MKKKTRQKSETVCMKKLFCRLVLGIALLAAAGAVSVNLKGHETAASAETALNQPLDASNPVSFYGTTVSYKGETITLNEKNIYIDGSLSDGVCDQYDYVYNDFKEAYTSGGITSGTEDAPMNVYIAPYVYWIDDPDDTAIREGVNGDNVPYGLWMNVSYLSLNGLTDNPENVVFAVNRGHNAGAKGNFTMFYINGTGTHTENMTFGNYCCVDLDFPLKPELSRAKRQETITQSQLILTNGSKITADNCNFISRLNSCPFVGGSRILFNDCHFECTDDSLPTSAVYVGCDFDFYSSRPFYSTTGSGSAFLGCDFNIKHGSNQYLTKIGGVVTIIDGTFYCTKKDQYIGWTPDPAPNLRCISGNIKVQYDYIDENGDAKTEVVDNYTMDKNAPYDNVDITGKDAMDAFKVNYNGNTIYNVYNLFKGADKWDPMKQKETLEAAGEADNKDYTDVPFTINVLPNQTTITDGETKNVSVSYSGFTASTAKKDTVTWSMEDSLNGYITIEDNEDGSCKLSCKNETLKVVKGMVYAKASSGLWAGVYVSAEPKQQPAPVFVTAPSIGAVQDGSLTINYELSNNDVLEDYSDIKWYRCNNADGSDDVQTAVSYTDSPYKTYPLSYGDAGYYIKAVITPKQQCTKAGEAVTVICEKKIELSDVTADPYVLDTDFRNFSTVRQARVLPGFWTKDVYKAWLADDAVKTTTNNPWTYGEGTVGYGDEGYYGLLQADRGSRMVYTPNSGVYGDMDLVLNVNPKKNAGQGFGSAGQYMDIYIKFDMASMTGYALRIERVSSLDCGVQAALVEYKDNTVNYISDKVLTSAFNTECTISLAYKSGVLSANITTTHEQSEKQAANNLQHTVSLSADAAGNEFGGLGLINTGTVGTKEAPNSLMFSHLTVNWDKESSKINDEISAADLKVVDLADVTCQDIPDAVYTGSEIIPDVVLTYNGVTLVKDVDYTVTYTNNIQPGTATVTITGKEIDYKGILKKTFVIKEKADDTPPTTTQPSVPKKGTVFTVSGIKYKITNNAKNKGTVTVVGVSKKTIASAKIPAAVTYKKVKYKVNAVGSKAFSGCKKLKSITIGSNVTTIGAQAFNKCGSLKKITVSSKVLKKIGKNAFKGINKKCVIKVPKSKLGSYKKLFKGKGQVKTVKIK